MSAPATTNDRRAAVPASRRLAALALACGLGLAGPARAAEAEPSRVPASAVPPVTGRPTVARIVLRLPAPDTPAVPLAELVCPPAPPRPTPPPPAPDAAPLELPAAADVERALAQAADDPPPARPGAGLNGLLRMPATGTPWRLAFWGDSHLAAAFFTEALAAGWGLPPGAVQTGLLPASLNRAGVRLPLRRQCVSPGWRHEPGHVGQNAALPGPGLANLSSDQPGAWWAVDLRHPGLARSPGPLRLLYQQTAEPITLALSVDGGTEQRVTLEAPPGPALLELQGTAPLSQLRVQLLQGQLRLHGLAPATDAHARVQLDVFGYPGATAAGWQRADLAYLGAWLQALQPRYDLVVLAFGTNEANDPQFQPARYEAALRQAVAAWRHTFPDAACLLIGPPDRGLLVPRPAQRQASRTARAGHQAQAGRATGRTPDLLRWSRLHAQVNRVQQQVAADSGCQAWSAQAAMGGPGSAYRWARQSPPLMARDLIHLTVPGYQQLGRQLFQDLGGEPAGSARTP